jgi:gluconate 2-dehydrogenase gamma chain
MERRDILIGGMVLVATGTAASVYQPKKKTILQGGTRWVAPPTLLPEPVDPGKLVFFTADEATLVGAIFDRLIPADDLTASATDMGCVTFTDYQLAGPYGQGASRYVAGPFVQGDDYQGNQSPLSPADWYKKGLPAFDAAVRKETRKTFLDLAGDQQDDMLRKLEAGTLSLPDSLDGKTLFQQFLNNVREGFLADPIYGGNRGMTAWKMIGFPGALYDYRDYVNRKGEKLDIAPVSLIGPIAAA